MALVAVYMATRKTNILGRSYKPFNSLLGETYELVTSDYKFIAEQVSHHPPVTAFNCNSEQYEVWA
jgi:oxysterol-binding protein-related protein 1/2